MEKKTILKNFQIVLPHPNPWTESPAHFLFTGVTLSPTDTTGS